MADPPTLVDPWEPTMNQAKALAELRQLAAVALGAAALLEAASLGSGAAFRNLQALRTDHPMTVAAVLDRAVLAAYDTVLPL